MVEVRRCALRSRAGKEEEKEEEEKDEEEEAEQPLVKSNNPHLAGGGTQGVTLFQKENLNDVLAHDD